MYSTCSSSSQEPENCKYCGSKDILHQFPCKHSFCTNCIITNINQALNNFKLVLTQNINALNSKISNFGCLKNCEQSKLSICKRQVLDFLEASTNLDQNQKQVFKELLDLSLGFFFGVKVQFYACVNCNEIRSIIGFLPLVCENCIGLIYMNQTNLRPKEVVYEYVIDSDEFHSKDEFLREFALVNCTNDSYESFELENNNFRINLVDRSVSKIRAVLLRAVIVKRYPGKIVVGDNSDTVQIVSRVKLIMK